MRVVPAYFVFILTSLTGCAAADERKPPEAKVSYFCLPENVFRDMNRVEVDYSLMESRSDHTSAPIKLIETDKLRGILSPIPIVYPANGESGSETVDGTKIDFRVSGANFIIVEISSTSPSRDTVNSEAVFDRDGNLLAYSVVNEIDGTLYADPMLFCGGAELNFATGEID